MLTWSLLGAADGGCGGGKSLRDGPAISARRVADQERVRNSGSPLLQLASARHRCSRLALDASQQPAHLRRSPVEDIHANRVFGSHAISSLIYSSWTHDLSLDFVSSAAFYVLRKKRNGLVSISDPTQPKKPSNNTLLNGHCFVRETERFRITGHERHSRALLLSQAIFSLCTRSSAAARARSREELAPNGDTLLMSGIQTQCSSRARSHIS